MTPGLLLEYAVPLWAHVALLTLALGLTAFVVERAGRREDRLRRKLGACRSALHAAEILRDQYRHQRDGLSLEVARYRKLAPPDMRLTQVMPRGERES